MSEFRDEAEKILENTYIYDNKIEGDDLVDLLNNLEALHKKEVERIIGEDENQNTFETEVYLVPDGVKKMAVPSSRVVSRNLLKYEQRQRANLKGGE